MKTGSKTIVECVADLDGALSAEYKLREIARRRRPTAAESKAANAAYALAAKAEVELRKTADGVNALLAYNAKLAKRVS